MIKNWSNNDGLNGQSVKKPGKGGNNQVNTIRQVSHHLSLIVFESKSKIVIEQMVSVIKLFET